MESMSRTERAALCNTALEAGRAGTDVVRSLDGQGPGHPPAGPRAGPARRPGILVPQLERLTDRSARRLAAQDFTSLVERVRSGPPRWSPMALPALDRAVNTLEFFVHHEDIRRAAPGWQPRELTEREQRALWKAISVAGKGLVRPAGVPVEIRWPGDEGDRTAVLRKGEDPAVVSGAPAELALFLFGRDQHTGLEFAGPQARCEPLTKGDLGI